MTTTLQTFLQVMPTSPVLFAFALNSYTADSSCHLGLGPPALIQERLSSLWLEFPCGPSHLSSSKAKRRLNSQDTLRCTHEAI